MEPLSPPLALQFPAPNADNTYTLTVAQAAELLRLVQHFRVQLERCKVTDTDASTP